MNRLHHLHRSRTAATTLGLLAALVVTAGLGHAADALKGREFFGPLRVNGGDTFQVVLTNLWSTKSSSVAVRIIEPDGTVVRTVGYDKEILNPKQLLPDMSEVVEITCDPDLHVTCDYTAIAELFSTSGGEHAPLLSAQVVKRDGTAGIWGTGGVALNAIWGTGGVARTGIWGTGGVARTGIWGTGGTAWEDTVGAFPAVRVAADEEYRLMAQNPYDDPMVIELSVSYSGGDLTGERAEIPGGGVVELTVPGLGDDVVGLVRLISSSAADAGPLTTMQVIRSDGSLGIWGTGGVAYEADEPVTIP